MLTKTHRMIASNIIVNISTGNKDIIDEKNFIKGNLKPDNISMYKLKKHYKDESFAMIISKIHFLSSLSKQEILTTYGKKRFNQELGVVCHFLCDYFCMAHHERWEFKNKFKRHVQYEVVLGRMAENYRYNSYKNMNIDIAKVADFINAMLIEYNTVKGFEADIIFAQYVCNSVVNTVLQRVKVNTAFGALAV
ncbi:zinc dependent phospholipase C family protein [Inconstantimicrobium mannanitabidum]|uniref:Uncharacterized protein n=1 Tax=Inconstantimicrobium mannanitabidum TaxID=1604901 RepID=A0ACB5R895_9CLOT|nr:zinc dependent phospholipase C family protein [Clostridium sp. TW13]GKX65094.1 hypothetical protein rsdtw13_03520 [Clostridium sp. TW13]